MSHDKPRPRRRWLRRFLILVALLVAAILVLPGLLADNFVRGKLEGMISDSLGADVTVSGLSLGWWSPVEADAVVIKEPGGGGTLLKARACDVDAGIWSLLFGSDTLRVTLHEPELTLRPLPDGRLNAMALVEGMPPPEEKEQDDEGSGLPERGAEIRIEGGIIRLGEGAAQTSYELDGGVSCDALDREPLRFKIGLVRAEGGSIEVGGSLAEWNVPGATPSWTGTVEATEVDLSTFAAVLGPVADLDPHGVVTRLLAAAEPRKGGSRLVLEADVQNLSVAKRGEKPGEPLESVTVRLGGALDTHSVSRLRGTVVVPQGQVELDPESHVSWDDSGVEGRLKVDGEVEDLQELEGAIAGLLPEGLEVSGRATVKGHVAGRWDRAPDIPWTKRLEGVDATFDLSATGVDYDGIAARDITAKASLADGQIKIEEASTSVGGGLVSIKGALPIAETAVGSNIEWTIAPLVTLERAFEGAGKVLVGVGGSGSVSMDDGGVRLDGNIALETLSAPDLPGMPLHLRKGTVAFGMRVDPDRSSVDIERLHLKEPSVDVLVERAGVVSEGGTTAVKGSITATVRPAFVHRVRSDARFTDAVTVRGTVGTNLDDPWKACALAVDLVAGGVVYEGHQVARLVAHVDKAVDVVTISSFECDVDGGSITGGGSLHADGLRDGDRVELVLDDVALAQPLADGAWRFDGRLSGKVTALGEQDASAAVVDLTVNDAELRGRAEVEASMKVLTLSGKLGRTNDGTLRADGVRAAGEGVSATVAHFVMPPPETSAPISVDAKIDAEAAWVSAMLAPWMPEDLELKQRIYLEAAGTAMADSPADSANATVTLRVPAASFVRRPVRDLVLVADVKEGRATVTEGRAQVESGSATLAGTFALARERRTRRDRLQLEARQLPLTVDQDLEPVAGNVRRVSTTGTLSGKVTVSADAQRALQFVADLDALALSRHLVVGSAAPETKRLPDLKIVARGSFEDDGPAVVRVGRLTVEGEDVKCILSGLVSSPELIEIRRATVILPEPVVQVLTLGGDPDPTFRPTGAVSAYVADLSASYDEKGELIPERLVGNGNVSVASCILAGLPGRRLGVQYVMRDGAITVPAGRVLLSGGTVKVLDGTRFGFGGDEHPFRLKAQVKDVKLQKGVRTRLAVLNPLLLAKPETDDATIAGVLDLDVDCNGTWSAERGWSKSVTGDGRIALTDANVKGSAVLVDLASQGDRLLGGTPAKAIFDVLGERGAIGKVLRPLSTEGLAFQDFDTGLTIQQGRVRLNRGLKVASKDLVLTIKGWGSLEGDLAYRVDTDVVTRLKQRAMKKLSEKNDVIGRILGAVNPLAGIGNIELGADVVGNALLGTPKISVNLFKPAGK